MTRPHPALIELARGGVATQTKLSMEILSSAIEHRMAGLLHTGAVDGRVTGPVELLAGLEAYDLDTWVRHQVIISELNRVKSLLDSAGIRFMVLKGVAAEARWYGRVGERPCWDLDLLIHPDDLGRVDDVLGLLQPGHVLIGETGKLTKAGYLQSFTVLSGRVVIDLHTDLFKLGVRSRSHGLLWETSVSVAVGNGGLVAVPSASFALVHFLTHQNRDRFNRLLGFVDVGMVLDDPDLDFDQVGQIVAEEGLRVVVYSALAAVADTLGRQLGSAAPRGWRQWVWQQMWPSRIRLRGVEGRVRFTRRALLLPFLLEGRMTDAVLSLWRRLAPPGALIEYRHGEQAGGSLMKVVRGRGAYIIRRWAARRRLKGHVANQQDE